MENKYPQMIAILRKPGFSYVEFKDWDYGMQVAEFCYNFSVPFSFTTRRANIPDVPTYVNMYISVIVEGVQGAVDCNGLGSHILRPGDVLVREGEGKVVLYLKEKFEEKYKSIEEGRV